MANERLSRLALLLSIGSDIDPTVERPVQPWNGSLGVRCSFKTEDRYWAEIAEKVLAARGYIRGRLERGHRTYQVRRYVEGGAWEVLWHE